MLPANFAILAVSAAVYALVVAGSALRHRRIGPSRTAMT
jgi:hypothetical protein